VTLRKPVPGTRSLPQLWRDICAASTPLELSDVIRTLRANDLVPPMPTIDFCPPRDEWLQLVREGKCFGTGTNVAGGVGTFAIFQIFNPAASGLSLFVFWWLAQGGAGGQDLIFETTTTERLAGANNFTPANLLVGGPARGAHVQQGSDATGSGGATTARLGQAFFATQAAAVQPMGGAGHCLVEVPPGTGIQQIAGSANANMYIEIAWAEVPAGNGYP
jgi:hypothetical protein